MKILDFMKHGLLDKAVKDGNLYILCPNCGNKLFRGTYMKCWQCLRAYIYDEMDGKVKPAETVGVKESQDA